jgi:hypothetical protein
LWRCCYKLTSGYLGIQFTPGERDGSLLLRNLWSGLLIVPLALAMTACSGDDGNNGAAGAAGPAGADGADGTDGADGVARDLPTLQGHMPEWVSASGHDGKYIDPIQAPAATVGDPVLDLWHWRGARSNPIGRSDDQNILAINFVDSSSGDDGGRKGDAGTGVFTSQGIVDGHPEYLLDPGTTSGKFVFDWENFWETRLHTLDPTDCKHPGVQVCA